MNDLAIPRAARHLRIPHLSRLGWLMGLYAENFRLFGHLFPVRDLAPGCYRSSIDDNRDLRLDLFGQHPYTTTLRLTYADIIDPVSGAPDPSAYLRLYHDSRQLEATHCHVGRNWHDMTGLHPPATTLLEHRLRMNTFLGKWLSYLYECGHRHLTPCDPATQWQPHRSGTPAPSVILRAHRPASGYTMRP